MHSRRSGFSHVQTRPRCPHGPKPKALSIRTHQEPHTYDQLEMTDHYLDYRRLMRHWHRVAHGRISDIGYED